jgi:feruloyl esterase
MAHGTPLATGDADFECGAAGPFLLEVGISSSFHIAKFFGLTAAGARTASPEEGNLKAAAPSRAVNISTLAPPQALRGEMVEDAKPDTVRSTPPWPPDRISAVITKALETAGLINRG